MIQRLPQRIGQHANEDVSLHAAAIVVPNGTKEEMTFENTKGVLDNRQLHVRFPELRRRPAALIAAEKIDPVSGKGRFELSDVPGPVQPSTSSVGDSQGDEGRGFGELALEPADVLQDLVPVFQAPGREPLLQLRKALAKPRRCRRRMARSFCRRGRLRTKR